MADWEARALLKAVGFLLRSQGVNQEHLAAASLVVNPVVKSNYYSDLVVQSLTLEQGI